LYEGGATLNSSGIQAVGVTDVADSLHAIDEVVFKKNLYTLTDIITAIDSNFQGEKNKCIKAALLAVPKFGDDSSTEATGWVSKVMGIYNNALDSVPNCPRNGRYSAGYYALNVATMYGRKTPALPSGRIYGVPLANSVTPHYGMHQADLLSSLNSLAGVNFTDHAENGTTATFSIDASLFQGPDGVKNLASIFKTYLTSGGMQLQPNVVSREILLDAYKHPEKHRYLMVRIAGYCAYFYELSDELKLSIINRTCYS
jgi:formate C-acetyltransferase